MKVSGQRPVYWENKTADHNKFWAASIQVEKQNNQVIFRLVRKWGLIGTNGQHVEQFYIDRYEAEKALDRLIWEKESKGYKAIF